MKEKKNVFFFEGIYLGMQYWYWIMLLMIYLVNIVFIGLQNKIEFTLEVT